MKKHFEMPYICLSMFEHEAVMTQSIIGDAANEIKAGYDDAKSAVVKWDAVGDALNFRY